jgi:signal transduction histidine kinase
VELVRANESLELRVLRRTEELSKQLEETKQAQETLRKTQEMLSEGQSLAKFGTVQRNLQTGAGWWSDEVYNILGIPPQKDPPTIEAFLERVHPDDVAWMNEMMASTRKTGHGDGEYRIIRSSGEELTIYGRARMHHGETRDSPVWVISTLMDITERKQAEMKLQALSRHLIQTQELERRRISLELHDQLGQDLALLSIGIEQLMQKAPESQAQLKEQLQELGMKTKELASKVQTLSHRLHPSKLVHLGLVAASRSLCNEVSESADIQIDFSHLDVARSIPQEVSTCLFRVLQESLTNVVKHSGAKTAQVELAGSPSEIQLEILDSGVGFDPESTGSRGGLGLISMRERLSLLGGELLIESRTSGNTWIKARLPLNSGASPN